RGARRQAGQEGAERLRPAAQPPTRRAGKRATTDRDPSRIRERAGPPRPVPASAANLFLRPLAPAPRLPGGPEEKEQDAEEDHGRLPEHRVRGIEEGRPVTADPHERDDPREVDDLDRDEPQQAADDPLPTA